MLSAALIHVPVHFGGETFELRLGQVFDDLTVDIPHGVGDIHLSVIDPTTMRPRLFEAYFSLCFTLDPVWFSQLCRALPLIAHHLIAARRWRNKK